MAVSKTNRFLLGIVAAIGVFAGSFGMVSAVSTFLPQQGGTGTTSPSGILYGTNSGTTPLQTLGIGSNLTLSGGVLSASGGSSAFPFTPNVWGNSTSTVIGFTQGIIANASSTFGAGVFLTPRTAGNLLYAGGDKSIQDVATSTLSVSSPLTGSFTQVGSGGSLGLGTVGVANGGTGSTTLAIGQLLYGSGTGAVQSVATTSVTCTGNASCSPFTIIGTSPITINAAGGAGSGLATTTPLSAGNLLEYSAAGSGAAFGVATSSLGVTGPITFSGTLGAQVGGAGGSFGCATCLTANQTITLSGVTTGSGSTAITTAFGTTAVANSILANITGGTAIPAFIATSSLGVALSDTTGTLAITRGGTGATSLTGSSFIATNAAGTAFIATSTPYSIANAVSTTTTLIYVDSNRSDSYTSDGSIFRPYKTIGTAIKTFPATYIIAPGTYVEAALTFTATSTVLGNQASIFAFSGTPFASPAANITFQTGFSGYDLNILVGNVLLTDTSLNDPGTFQNSLVAGNITLSGLAVFQGGQIGLSTADSFVYTKAGSLTNFLGVNMLATFGVAGIANFNDVNIQPSQATGKYAISATTTGSVLQMNGVSIENIASAGGGILCTNGATTMPNSMSALALTLGTTTNLGAINCTGSNTSLGTYSVFTNLGVRLYATVPNLTAFSHAGINVEGQTILSQLSGNTGVATTSPWGQLSVNGTWDSAIPSFVVGSTTSTGTSTLFIINKNGNVGINTATPANLLSILATATSSASITAGGVQNIRQPFDGSALTVWKTGSASDTGRGVVFNQDSTSDIQDFILATSSCANCTDLNLKGMPTGKGILKIEATGGAATGFSNASAISIDTSQNDTQGVFIKSGTGIPLNIQNSSSATIFKVDAAGNASSTGYLQITGSATSTLTGAIQARCFSTDGTTCLGGGGGSGTVTNITTSNGVQGGTITTTGNISLISYIATSSAETAGQLAVWGTTSGTPGKLYSLATSTLTNGTGISMSGTSFGVGGSNNSISINQAASLTWTGTEAFNTNTVTFGVAPTFSAMTLGSVLFAGTAGVLSQNNANFFWDNGVAALGIGTTSPKASLTVSSSTAPQVMLTDASATSIPWTLRSINGNFYFATSSPTTFATSTFAAISIKPQTLSQLIVGATSSVATFPATSAAVFLNEPNGVNATTTVVIGDTSTTTSKSQIQLNSDTGATVCLIVHGTTLVVSSGKCN